MKSYKKLFTGIFSALLFALPNLFAERSLFTPYEGSWYVVQKVVNSTPYVQVGDGLKEASGELYAIKETQSVQPAANASVEVAWMGRVMTALPGQNPVIGNADLLVIARLLSKTDLSDLVVVFKVVDPSGQIDYIVREMAYLKAGIPDTFAKMFPLGRSVLDPDSYKFEFFVFRKGIELRQTKAP